MKEIAISAIVLIGLSWFILVVNDKYIKTRLWRQYLWWRTPRMDVRAEERAWELVADAALDCIDKLFLAGNICAELRLVMLKKLQKSPGLGYQFSPRAIQRTLKEVIRGRLGTHTAPRFPDPGPYVFAYSSIIIGDRSKPDVVLLTVRSAKWRTKRP